MIYTVTVNPAIDYVIGVEDFCEGEINRTTTEDIFAGGKGINVSTVLKNLGCESIALGFVAGATGELIEEMLNRQGIDTDFLHISEGNTRINVKMHTAVETEINGGGPVIRAKDIAILYTKLDKLVEGDYIVMSGNIPMCLQGDAYQVICRELAEDGLELAGKSFYCDICAKMCAKGVQFVVDATKELLVDTIEYRPVLIKPNNHELGEIFGVNISSYEDAIKYAKKLQNIGARNVMVSMASKGAILIDENAGQYICSAPAGKVINSVGAGDTMVAAFLSRYISDKASRVLINYEQILKYAVAAGSATAFKAELVKIDDISQLFF